MATTHRIAETLRVRRAFTGQKQAELAKEIGLSQPTLSQLEDGRAADKSTKAKITDWLFERIP